MLKEVQRLKQDISQKIDKYFQKLLQKPEEETQNRFSVLTGLKSDSHLPKKFVLKGNKYPLKIMKNACYFILKTPFVLKIFKIFVLTFRSFRKNGLIRKIRKDSKFMMSQPG